MIQYTESNESVASVADLKQQLRIDADWSEDDELLARYLLAATSLAERRLQVLLRPVETTQVFDGFRTNSLRLSLGPVQEVRLVRYIAKGESEFQELERERYRFNQVGIPARVIATTDEGFPDAADTASVEVSYTAGYDRNVPAGLVQVVLMLAAKMYEYRDDPPHRMQTATDRIIQTYRNQSF